MKKMSAVLLGLTVGFSSMVSAATTNFSGLWKFNVNGFTYDVEISQNKLLLEGTMVSTNSNEPNSKIVGSVSGSTIMFSRDISPLLDTPQNYVGYFFQKSGGTNTMAGELYNMTPQNTPSEKYGWYATKVE
ncbi:MULTISPECIES: hypothetical protein [Vibrio]|uniref:DUF2147 domain-containing protein n=2 Tax=Vibrio TaxID=662 RepID=A0ABX6R283_9VIBR|nr:MULTISPECIES: hypothetical protein [Vibrio]ASA55296.1 hypothetical protein BSQ33_05870 [Vibrio gazogenes]QMV15457.1 hypothetical protein Vspart_02764 [Vibrio spartinae]